jgi:hypothetical protein
MYFSVDCHSDRTVVELNKSDENRSQDFVNIEFWKMPVEDDVWTRVATLSMHIEMARAEDLVAQMQRAIDQHKARLAESVEAAQ